MEQTYYEKYDNFRPVYNTAIALLQARKLDEICGLLLNATIDVVNTDYNDWYGGTYGYTVYIGIDVPTYALIDAERVGEIEQIVSEALNESIRGDEHNSFSVSISPKLIINGCNWDAIGGISAKDSLRQDIETVRNIMISVSTGGSRIQEEENRYRTINATVVEKCKKANIVYNNDFKSLWDWYDKWKAELPKYQERRLFVNNLFSPTFEALDTNTETSSVETLVNIDEWDRIKRTLAKIKRNSTIAKNEEDYQTVGLLCRELLISLAQAVFKPEMHGSTDDDGTVIGKTDAVRMIENYIRFQLKGSYNEELRTFAKNANKLANTLTHKRNATKKDMMLTISSTVSVINLIGVLEEKY